jgi:hypothetical protein
MTIQWKASTFTLVCWLTACGGSQAPADVPGASSEEDTQDPNGKETDLKSQFLREADPIQKMPVNVPGAWTAYIEAKSPPKFERLEKVLNIKADLGWENEIDCFIYDDIIDTAAASQMLLSAADKNVDFTSVAAYSLKHHNLDPIVSLRGIYQVMQNKVLAMGDYKIMVMPRQKFPMVCLHDAPGYAESFARVTAEFAQSFQFEDPALAPQRGELWQVTVDGTLVGFDQQKTYKLEDGGVRRVQLSARLLPTAPGQLSFKDEVEIVNSDVKGVVRDGTFISNQNGESVLQLDLEKTKGGYAYAGTVQGKQVNGDFKVRQPLLGMYAAEKHFKSIKSTKKQEFQQNEYLPSLDPTKPVEVKYEITPKEGGFGILASLGQTAIELNADEQGVLRSMRAQMGGKALAIDLVEEVGEL